MKTPSIIRKLLFLGQEPKESLVDFFVRCPHCETLYALYHHVNWATVNDVRCGTCSNTFNTLRNKSQPKGEIEIDSEPSPYQPRLSRAAPESISSAERAWSDLMENNDSEFTDRFSTETPDFNAQTKTPRYWETTLLKASVVIGINLLIGSGVWIEREALIQNTYVRPSLAVACDYLHCQLPAYRDPEKIIVQQHQLTTDPSNDRHLQLHAVIENAGAYAQPLADLELIIDDLQGNSVNTVTFKPKEFAPTDPNLLLAPGQTLHISLILTEATPSIFSYELRFI